MKILKSKTWKDDQTSGQWCRVVDVRSDTPCDGYDPEHPYRGDEAIWENPDGSVEYVSSREGDSTSKKFDSPDTDASVMTDGMVDADKVSDKYKVW